MKDRNTLILCRRIMAIMLCAFISFAYMPFTGVVETRAYANGGEAQTVSEAEAQWNEAKRIKDVAQDSVNIAQGEFNAAESEYKAAVADRVAKENAKASALSQYESAQTATQTALNEKNAAQTAKDEAQTTLSQATTNLEEKTTAVTTAQNDLTQAQQAVNAATDQWDNEKASAQEVFDAAKESYDNAGYEFINDKVNALGNSYYSIDEIIEKEKTSTYGPVKAWNGTDSLYVSDVVSDSNFIKIVKDNCSYDNLKEGIEIMRRTNALRTSDRHGLNEIGVSYQLIANAVVSNSITAYLWGHYLTQSSGYLYWTIDTPWNYRPRNENLACSTIPMGSAYDPFDGLYYEERIVKLGQEAGGLTQAIIDRVAAEAASDGSGYVPKSLSELSEETVTGHYLAIIEPALTAQGAAYSYTPNELLNYMGYWKYRARVAQAFNNTTTNVITLSQYETALENHFAEKKTSFETAKAEVERLETKPDYLQQAETTLSEKQTALETANQQKTAAETAKSNAESALSAAETALSEKTTIYNNAVSNEGEKQTAYNNAVTAYNAAVQTEANKKDARDSAAGTLETKNNALTGATEAEAAAKAVYDSFFKLENAIISAVPTQTFTGSAIEPSFVVKNKGETDTLVKGTDYDVEFSKNTNVGTASVKIKGTEGSSYTGEKTASFNIVAKEIEASMVTVTPLEADYSGNKQMPQVSVQYNGITLENGKDYTLTNNGGTNTGEYDVVVTAKENGNYSGTVSAKFKINTKDIAGADVEVSAIPEQLLTTEALRPEVTITYNGKSLATEDYDVAYRDNESEGTGRVTITGKGNFTGSREGTFRILLKERAELNDLIKELEEELNNESDEEYLAEINAAIVEARALAEDKNAGREALSAMASKTRAASSAAKEALDERKAAAGKTAEEEEAARKAAEQMDWNGTLSGAVPAAKSVKAKAAKKSVKVSWKKATKKNLKKFDKVEIQVCTDRGFNRANTKRVEVKKSKKSATVKGLVKGMTYYVRVRDVKGSGTGKLVSKWSGVKKVKIKK